ncbi:MAG: hypothetical protein JF593_13225 [Novosphingobium sp.]|nr:hypothetical protein [Novosphingobium sp.]
MARIKIRAPRASTPTPPPEGISGPAEARCYFAGEGDPVHLHLLRIPAGEAVRLDPVARDRLAFVWHGAIAAGGHDLTRGSSLIVEHGARLEIRATGEEAVLVLFAPAPPAPDERPGGHVHLLPRERVPRIESSPGSSTSGHLHTDGRCPTCDVWLNENALPGRAEPPSAEEALMGIHAHPENEIIFVIEGRMRVGGRMLEPGTALAIAADTLYGFAPGPEGVGFITFRPTTTHAIRFARDNEYAHSTYFDGAGPVPYLEPLPA